MVNIKLHYQQANNIGHVTKYRLQGHISSKEKTLMHNIYQYLNNPVETLYVINEKYNIDGNL